MTRFNYSEAFELHGTVRGYVENGTMIIVERLRESKRDALRSHERWEIDTIDAIVREKLIALGWTPPSLAASDGSD